MPSELRKRTLFANSPVFAGIRQTYSPTRRRPIRGGGPGEWRIEVQLPTTKEPQP